MSDRAILAQLKAELGQDQAERIAQLRRARDRAALTGTAEDQRLAEQALARALRWPDTMAVGSHPLDRTAWPLYRGRQNTPKPAAEQSVNT